MKIGISLLILSLIVTIDGLPHYRSARRSFRIMGASDRFSHGFGKRADGDTLELPQVSLEDDDINLVTDEDLATLIVQNPKVALAFVQKYIDLNGDGAITKQELVADSRK